MPVGISEVAAALRALATLTGIRDSSGPTSQGIISGEMAAAIGDDVDAGTTGKCSDDDENSIKGNEGGGGGGRVAEMVAAGSQLALPRGR